MFLDDLIQFISKAKDLFLLIFVFFLAALSITIFNSYYYGSEIMDAKAKDIESYFKDVDTFTRDAKTLIDSRSDVLYLTLIDSDGVVLRSYGSSEGASMKKYPLKSIDKHTIILGLKDIGSFSSFSRSFLWALAISLVCFFIYVMLRYMLTYDRSAYMEKLSRAINTVSGGNYTVKLAIDHSVSTDPAMLKLYESFNHMVSQTVKLRGGTEIDIEHFQPQLVETDEGSEVVRRSVVTFIAKLSTDSNFGTKLSAEDFEEFLNQFREETASIVEAYGGQMEAVFQDEIVAFFNVPDEIDNPALRAISAGVEVLQKLAVMNKDRNLDSKAAIGGKMGIEISSSAIDAHTGSPHNLKDIISHARFICENSPSWKVMISDSVLNEVGEHVDVKRFDFEDKTIYSVTGVEEGVIGT